MIYSYPALALQEDSISKQTGTRQTFFSSTSRPDKVNDLYHTSFAIIVTHIIINPQPIPPIIHRPPS